VRAVTEQRIRVLIEFPEITNQTLGIITAFTHRTSILRSAQGVRKPPDLAQNFTPGLSPGGRRECQKASVQARSGRRRDGGIEEQSAELFTRHGESPAGDALAIGGRSR
jgi:hypothetical protein